MLTEVPPQLRGMTHSQKVCMAAGPLAQVSSARRLSLRDEQSRHQPLDFLLGQEHVVCASAHQAREEET